MVGLKKQKSARQKNKGTHAYGDQRRLRRSPHAHLLTRTIHNCLLQAPFLVSTNCILGLQPDKFEVLDGSSIPKRVFLTGRRFNVLQPV